MTVSMFRSIMLAFIMLAMPPLVSAGTNPKFAIKIEGDLKNPSTFSAEEMSTLPRVKVSLKDKSGALRQYEGVLIADLVARAQPLPLSDAHGAEIRFALLIQGRDGYGGIFSAAEINANLSSQPILLVDKVDGLTLSDEDGPLRIVVPSDLKSQRWIKQVTLIRVKSF